MAEATARPAVPADAGTTVDTLVAHAVKSLGEYASFTQEQADHIQVVAGFRPVEGEYLDHATVAEPYDAMLERLARTYVHALDVIHYMHDRYAYERLEMALHDREVLRTMACGIAGLSVAADSLSAIKHARVRVIRDATGLAVDYETEGDYPAYGNNDDRADEIARGPVHGFMEKVRRHPTYRGAVHTQSVLTVTSNVVYGKKTGNTPDGRRAAAPTPPSPPAPTR